jgi:hypothetical protein
LTVAGEIANASLCETGTLRCQQKLSDPTSRAHVANGSLKLLSVAGGCHRHTYTTRHFLRDVIYVLYRNGVVVWLLQCRHSRMFPQCTVGVCPFSENRSSVVQRQRRPKQWRTEGGGLGCSNPPPPRNSENIGGVLDRMSKKNRRLDFLLQFTVFSYGSNLLNKGFF